MARRYGHQAISAITRFRPSCHVGSTMPKSCCSLRLSSTDQAGRLAGVGYSELGIASTVGTLANAAGQCLGEDLRRTHASWSGRWRSGARYPTTALGAAAPARHQRSARPASACRSGRPPPATHRARRPRAAWCAGSSRRARHTPTPCGRSDGGHRPHRPRHRACWCHIRPAGGRLVLAVGCAALAIEHVVGGVMHERHAVRPHQRAITPGACALAANAASASCSARSTAV